MLSPNIYDIGASWYRVLCSETIRVIGTSNTISHQYTITCKWHYALLEYESYYLYWYRYDNKDDGTHGTVPQRAGPTNTDHTV